MPRLIYLLSVLLFSCSTAAAAQMKKVTYFYSDPQGNVVAEADEQGNVTRSRDYTPYGGAAIGSFEDGPAYTGHFDDYESGFIYMQARYQDPTIGRFSTKDPVAPVAGNVFSFNRYSYANNNPSTNVDPDGRTVVCSVNTCTINSRNRFEQIVDYGTVGIVYTQRLIHNAFPSIPDSPIVQQETHESAPTLPGDLVGVQDGKAGEQGKRVNSGPLDPAHGGAGDAVKDFDTLTGGKSSPASEEKKYPAGTLVGENGISLRPQVDGKGPRIDIPANGDKPHETLHYPKSDTFPL